MSIAPGIHPALDDLDAVQIGTQRVLARHDKKSWSAIEFTCRPHIGAHGDAVLVGLSQHIRAGVQIIPVVPAGK